MDFRALSWLAIICLSDIVFPPFFMGYKEPNTRHDMLKMEHLQGKD
jgi:hypothetical protein